jgi:hypothetical protein
MTQRNYFSEGHNAFYSGNGYRPEDINDYKEFMRGWNAARDQEYEEFIEDERRCGRAE